VADGDEAAIGRPIVDGASVSAEVVRQDRADKVIVFKYRPKARRRVKKGHRQDQTVLRISDITLAGKSAAAAAKKASDDAKTERQRLAEAAAKQAAADAALAAKLASKAKASPDETGEAPAAEKARPSRGRAKAKGAAAEASPPSTGEPPSATTSDEPTPGPAAKPKRRATKKDE
jgi:large subunit ribosomal protein L21